MLAPCNHAEGERSVSIAIDSREPPRGVERGRRWWRDVHRCGPVLFPMHSGPTGSLSGRGAAAEDKPNGIAHHNGEIQITATRGQSLLTRLDHGD